MIDRMGVLRVVYVSGSFIDIVEEVAWMSGSSAARCTIGKQMYQFSVLVNLGKAIENECTDYS